MNFRASFRRAFTLIEILIVVAIIAILALIAIPNMLEAQTRAKVSRVLADHRTLVTAMECYRLDNNNYPVSIINATTEELYVLTTPVAYLTSVPMDPFQERDKNGLYFPQNVYDMVRFQQTLEPIPILHVNTFVSRDVSSHYFLVSPGPDNRQEHYYIITDLVGFLFKPNTYDPTNGTVSRGDIYTFGSSAVGK